MLLSAALIVRDEAAVLDDCLTSLRGLVDEIVVVDTGSVDDTVAIARAHDVVLGHFEWRADFAAARNHALDLAHGEWIIYVDADERVRPGDHGGVRDALRAADGVVAFRVRLVPRVGWTPYREFRLWRHRPDVRFARALHETIIPALEAAARSESLRIEPFDLLIIDHVGYEGDQSRKRPRDEPMLEAAIAAEPTRSFLYDHLARVHEAAGEHDLAAAAWRRGIDAARGRGYDHPEDVAVLVNLCSHLQTRGDPTGELDALLAEAERVYPEIPTVQLALARHELAAGGLAAAEARLEALVRLDEADLVDTSNSYDGRVFGEWAWELLGLCRFRRGDDAGAAAAFRTAEALAPGVERYGVQRRLAEARARAAATDEPGPS